LPKISIFELHFPWLVHVYVPLFPCSWPRNHMHNATYSAIWRVMAVQGHPRSSTLVPIESLYAT